MDELSLRFSRFFIRHRRVNIILIGAATAYFGWEALQLQVFSQFIDLLPRNHPYIQVYENYNRQFGSANIVTAAIVAQEGSIYDESVLEKIYGFTDQIDKVEGVDHGQVSSITSIGIRNQEVDREGILRSQQIVGEEPLALLEAQFFTRRAIGRARAGGSPGYATLSEFKTAVDNRKAELVVELSDSAALRLEKMEDRAAAEAIQVLREEAAELEFLSLRLGELPDDYRIEGEELIGPEGRLIPAATIESLPDRIHQNKQVYGRLVSIDDTAALVSAGFLEGRLDYEEIFARIYRLKTELEADGKVVVHLTGQPILIGWTFFYALEIVFILLLSLAILVALLGIYFRHWYGIVMPLSGAIVSAIWGLGFISIMGYQLEPLVLVIPMLITARAVSHSVQFVERFYEEYERLENKEEAVITSMAELLLPGTLAIVTDAFGILVIGVSSIALMKKVAIFGAFWALSIAVTEMLLNRLLIVYFPAPKNFNHYTPGPVKTFLKHTARIATGERSARIVLVIWLVVVVSSFFAAYQVKVGESRPGTPILWDDSEFNQSARVISSKFFGADDFMVIVETEEPIGVHRPEVMREIEAFQRYMEQDPAVGGSISIVDFLKAINRTFHNGDPRWFRIPSSDQEIGGLLYLYEAGSPDPRILNPYRDQEARNAAIRIFYRDHQGDTIRGAVARSEEYIEKNPTGKVSIRLATDREGFVGEILNRLGPLIPPPRAELEVRLRDAEGDYHLQEVTEPNRQEPPPEDSDRWILTLPRTTKELKNVLVDAGFDNVQKIADADLEALAELEGFDLVTAYALQNAAELDRRNYTVRAEWEHPGEGEILAQIRRRGLYEADELWVKYHGASWEWRKSSQWAEGPSYALASGLMGVLGASNDEVEGSNNATLIASFATVFMVILLSYRSLSIGLLLIMSLGSAALVSLAFMFFARIGFDVNTLPVQALGVGVGVDYALYIMDRVVHERKRGHDLKESVSIAIQTTGMAVFFTGSTLVGGIIFWYFISSLRFAADMSLLLSILLLANMVGAILVVPAFTTVFKPRFAQAVGDGARAAEGPGESPAGSEA
jgi:predicted RND superfamily exporter protein